MVHQIPAAPGRVARQPSSNLSLSKANITPPLYFTYIVKSLTGAEKIPEPFLKKKTRGGVGGVRYQYNPNKKKFRKTLKKQAQDPGRLSPLSEKNSRPSPVKFFKGYIYTYGAERRAPNTTPCAGRNAAPRICEIGSMLPHMPRTRNQEIGIFRRAISTMGITFP